MALSCFRPEPRSPSLRSGALSLLLLLATAATSHAGPDGKDRAGRGLDLFVHAPAHAAPGGALAVQLEAVGFPTVTTLVPLGGAAVEAAWDPESLGPGMSRAPAPVRVTADDAGRARLEIAVPPGDERDLVLLLGVRSGEHTRTRQLKVHRERGEELGLFVADRRVVPGSSISSWVRLTSAVTGAPLARAAVEIALLEGGFARFEARLTTDAGGTALTRVPIPRSDEASWTWELRARTLGGPAGGGASASVDLTPRDETPGSPTLAVEWAAGAVLAGETARFELHVRDATDAPVASLPVRWWVGPKGTSPPEDAEGWLRASTPGATDGGGAVTGQADAPATLVKGVGTTLRLVARATVDGHDLRQQATIAVGTTRSTVTLTPEAAAIVPGVEQRMLLEVRDAHEQPVAAGFLVEGDGLHAEVRTDAFGEAEVTWLPPLDVGALRNLGPCAGGVAAAVRVRATTAVAQLRDHPDAFESCVAVDRDASARVELDRTVARTGDRLRVRVHASATGGHADRLPSPVSVILRPPGGGPAMSAWFENGEEGGLLDIPAGASGVWSVDAATPNLKGAARIASTALLVTPRTLPKLTASVGGGRAAPGGAVEIEAALTDGHGTGLPGTVAALVVDLHGGGNLGGIAGLDARTRLCRALGVTEGARCDRVVEGDPAFEAMRRGALAGRRRAPLAPAVDPGRGANEELSKTFGRVLRSLEGALFEATASPERLRDVRRKLGRGTTWNPELMTLVTATMDPPPETPGGEPLALADLLAVDPQVTFDNTARRITRLKLFNALVAVRAFRHEHALDDEEPVLKQPNALLRRLVREGRLTEDMLLDPWGGTVQFVRASGPAAPFLGVLRGFELRSPGPDGTVGNGDDVRDPFERVLRSGTPYAKAVDEDRVVDARAELEVGDATIEAWKALFSALTGTAIGDSFGSGGLGLSGVGEGGGGRGEGIGLGSIGTLGHGAGRGSFGTPDGVAFWSLPARTDANGHVRVHVPLGDAETTWGVALVGVPDGLEPATATVEVPVALPLSARADTGATWVEGASVDVAVLVRNRSASAASATLTASAGGVAALGAPQQATQRVEVPAGGAKRVTVRVVAPRAGRATLDLALAAPGLPDDAVHHAWEVLPAGEATDLMSSTWVEGRGALTVPTGPSLRLVGTPRLVLERGYATALAAALDSLDPDLLSAPSALADAVEVASRVQRWATGRGGDADPLALRSGAALRRALGRMIGYGPRGPAWAMATARARSFALAAGGSIASAAKLPEPSACPDAEGRDLDARLTALDAEPAARAGVDDACWTSFADETLALVQASADPVIVARALVAIADRPQHASLAAALADRLRELTQLRASGAVRLAAPASADRASRALVFAALLRAASLGTPGGPSVDRLVAWAFVQRDRDGGYGSPLATRAVVRAILSAPLAGSEPSTVVVVAGGVRREVTVGPDARVALPLDDAASGVELEVRGPGLVARLERPALRLWSSPPDETMSPLHVHAKWPADATAGKTGVLELTVQHDFGRAVTVDLRVPLPPGVTLAEREDGVRQAQGVLAIRRAAGAGGAPTVIKVALRFALAGRVTVPEGRAWVAFESQPRALLPARPLVIQ